MVSARCGSGELGVTRRQRFPAVSKGEMGSGDAQQHGEKREQERSGGGARRRTELAEYGGGTGNSDERFLRLRDEMEPGKRGKGGGGQGLYSHGLRQEIYGLKRAEIRGRKSRVDFNHDEQVTSGDVIIPFLFLFPLIPVKTIG